MVGDKLENFMIFILVYMGSFERMRNFYLRVELAEILVVFFFAELGLLFKGFMFW